ncbi:MAG: hypothetical protein OXB90_08860 [Acidimicrobiaceae bacterium]|nr:hypothetical protein [Acidimicrobiaceae bacterium]
MLRWLCVEMGLRAQMHEYRLALKTPLVTAFGVVEQRQGILFAISNGTHCGWGEAAPLPGWSDTTLDDCRSVLRGVAQRVPQFEDAAQLTATTLLSDLEAFPYARAAVSGAILDLLAQAQGVTLGVFLQSRFEALRADGADADDRSARSVFLHSHFEAFCPPYRGALPPVSEVPTSVRVNGLVTDPDPQSAAAAAANLVADGISAIKLKVGAVAPQVDIARVVATRRAIGDTIELRLDANGAWNVDVAITTLRKMAQCDVAFCEEPTAGIAGIAAVGEKSVVPVGVDESAKTCADIFAALQTKKIAVVILKPQTLGGSDVAFGVLAQLESFGVRGVVSTMIDSVVGVAHAAHLAVAALPDEIHGLHTSVLLADDVAPNFVVEGSRLCVPSGVGLGVAPRVCMVSPHG